MNFQSLHYFIMLAREKNFTRAAEKLHISQQTLSASIAALERELNCKLIIRHVPLELTYGGRTFFHYALSLTGEEESMRRSLLDIAEEKNRRTAYRRRLCPRQDPSSAHPEEIRGQAPGRHIPHSGIHE